MQRVVITGLGVITPLGCEVNTLWNNLVNGVSGISLLTDLSDDLRVRFAGTVNDFADHHQIDEKECRKMDPFIQYGCVAADQALKQANISPGELDSARVGVAMGSGIGGLTQIESNHLAAQKKGSKRISPFFIPATIINLLPGLVSIKYGFQGPNYSVVTACTTGAHNLGFAYRSISLGETDVMVAGGAEKASTLLGMGGFASMRALSTRNDDPTAASRPFDQDRDGFVLSDGAGVMVLESYEHAKKRGVPILGEIVGYAMNSDGHHMTQPSPSGMVRVMEAALKSAQLEPSEIDHINPHATSTPFGDQVEASSIQSVFGKVPPVSATKSMHGHMLGATGAVEAIIALLSLQNQCVLPTINCDNLAFDMPIVREATAHTMSTVLSNSFGFGGTNASLILSSIKE